MKKLLALCAGIALVCAGCAKKSADRAPAIALFITGIIADSPAYAHLAAGTAAAVYEYNAAISDEKQHATLY
ncbi:MAG: BMP family ABC transporter substrate-binding protein, partial [Treponemataceae bacterium]|nr:BMP family ABC transporter substrate-binding protein [Treponemataceae bacterium]